MKDIPIIPGRGLNTDSAKKMRTDYLQDKGISIDEINNYSIDVEQLRHNIESFIGSVEIPLGIIGPLLYNDDNGQAEEVYAAAGTIEGALIASMNRGSRAISLSGGFNSYVLHQKMIRSPLFLFEKLSDAASFKTWIDKNFNRISVIAGSYSNHAVLNDIQSYIIGKSIQLKFIYSTGDASGQNMTTSCTWHSVLWIVENFPKETDTAIVDFVIEGNGASDKKSSIYAASHGRGIHVVAECFLEESILQKVLRISSADILRFYTPSVSMSKIDGMTGYNINVANAIASIFVATGQDLGSIHESATAILNVEPYENGLYLSLNLPTLVIGTVGGGTHISRQKEALEIMGCYGNGKIERFARLIAGFSLALEISTYAAIVSGGFAKAHEKLGRNKPVKWLLKSEIDNDFVQKYFSAEDERIHVVDIDSDRKTKVDNGILSDITGKISNKLIGFVTANVEYSKNGKEKNKRVLLKSKAIDIEVIKGLHFLAAAIDTGLADLINFYKENLEYSGCHLKEINMYSALTKEGFTCIPKYYGNVVDSDREIYLLAMEVLKAEEIKIIDSEDDPGLWKETEIKKAIYSITEIHKHFSDKNHGNIAEVKPFKVWEAIPLYLKFLELLIKEEDDSSLRNEYKALTDDIDSMQEEFAALNIPLTIIHNDFNPRNIAVRNSGQLCIYDWELAVKNIPHRDIVELLSFVLSGDFPKETLLKYIDYHYSFYKNAVSKSDWYKGYKYALKELIISRLSFYEVSGIIIKFPFSNRVMRSALRMLRML